MPFTIRTKSNGDFVDLTARMQEAIDDAGLTDGAVLVFAKHTTVSIVIADNESGLKRDFTDALDRLFPPGREHRRNTPGDAHLRSMVCGCSVTVPVIKGKPKLEPG